MSTPLEKYLLFAQGRSNEALTPQLQALAEGRDLGEWPEAPAASAAIGPHLWRGELTDDDREELRRWSLEHGYRICMRLLDNWIQEQEDGARQSSIAGDPLGNQSELAKAWAYVAMQRRVKNAMEGLIAGEIAKLK